MVMQGDANHPVWGSVEGCPTKPVICVPIDWFESN